jgi:hypothetical protein
MWQPISTAPYDRDLELAVINSVDTHALVFPCRRTAWGWIDARTKRQVDVRPSHWRLWDAEKFSAPAAAQARH